MAYIEPRKNKNGEIIAYRIRVNKGYDANGKKLKPFEKTFKPDPEKSERQNMKALNEVAVEFEKKCKQGYVLDNRQSFAKYADYVIRLKERVGVKRTTIEGYKMLLPRINEEIGHMKLSDIRPQHLNIFYEKLSQRNTRQYEYRATAIVDLKNEIRSKGLSFQKISDSFDVSVNTIAKACKGERILKSKAEQIAKAIDKPLTKLFIISHDSSPLSAKTVLEYHRFINMVFKQADKEMIVPYNPASKATPPKVKRSKVNFFELDQLEQIQEEVDKLPIKWRTIIHLLMITGARRGEIAGLKWDAIDWEQNSIYIHINLLHSTEYGTYVDSTKTEYSERYVNLPTESMELIKQYRQWFEQRKEEYGSRWHDTGYLFVQEKAENAGKPINPDGITAYLNDFSEKYDLPHINPHAFRHTQASLLYYGGMDSVSISKRLGHSKVSTTTDLYAHIIRQADERNAECIADTVLRSNRIEISRKENRA